MGIEKIIFYCFSAVMLFAALMVISSRNTVHSVLFLVLSFVAASGLWLMLEAEFLAIVLVLVYVGAVMVLFLFVVMMLNINVAPLEEGFTRYLPIGVLIAALLVGQIVWLLMRNQLAVLDFAFLQRHGADYSNIHELGMALYTDYLYPFEIAGVILLVAVIAAMALTFRGPKNRRKQDISEQVKVRKEDRLKIIKDL